MKHLSKQQLGIMYAVISGLCYGFLGYFGTSLINSGLSVYNMVFWRFAIATLFMCLIMTPKYKTIFSYNKKNLMLILYGIVFYTGSTIFYFIASKYIGTGLAMIIFFTYPAIIMLFNRIFFQTALQKTYYAAFFIILIGMIFLADIGDISFNMLGIILGMLGALFFAFYIIASKKTYVTPRISTLMVSLGGTISCFILSHYHNTLCIPNNINDWFNIAGIAILCTAMPVLLFLKGLQYISIEQASILSVLEPITVLALGVVLLGEKISFIQTIGVIIILSGAVITLLPNKTEKHKSPSIYKKI